MTTMLPGPNAGAGTTPATPGSTPRPAISGQVVVDGALLLPRMVVAIRALLAGDGVGTYRSTFPVGRTREGQRGPRSSPSRIATHVVAGLLLGLATVAVLIGLVLALLVSPLLLAPAGGIRPGGLRRHRRRARHAHPAAPRPRVTPMMPLMNGVEHWLLVIVASPWALLVLLLSCYLDALFPPVPSETVVLALGTLAVSGHGPHPALVVLLAATGAFLGDRTAYAIGGRMPSGRLPFVRRDRAVRLLTQVRDQLDRRGAAFILSARYVPVGRVAVNVGAGMVGFPARRFTAYAALSSVLWATWTVLLGVFAGALLQGRPLVSVAAGVVGGLLVGIGIDAVLRWRARRD